MITNPPIANVSNVMCAGEKVMTSLGKLILIIWLFVVLILNSSYTASLASILTVQQLSPTIRDIETLRASNASIGHLDGSFVKKYLTDELKIEQRRLVSLVHPQDYVALLRNETIGAVVDETPYINMLMSQHCGKFAIVGRTFYKGGFGFVFSKGFPMLPEMTTAVLNITQNKTGLEEIRSKWFCSQSSSSSSSSSCNDESSITDGDGRYDSDQLSAWSFWGLFVITTTVYFLIVFSYFGHKFYKSRLISTRVENVPSTPPDTPLMEIQLEPAYSDISSSSPQPNTTANTTSHADLIVRRLQRGKSKSV